MLGGLKRHITAISALSFFFASSVHPFAQLREAGSEPLRQVRKAYKAGELRPDRIILGHDTSIEKHPWQVAVLDATVPDKTAAQFCGGSIVAPRWVLTAAHCVDADTKPGDVVILAGATALSSAVKPVAVEPGGIIVHENWNPKTHENDIALIHVREMLSGTPIPGGVLIEHEVAGQEVTITGWGAIAWQHPALKTNILQEVALPIVDRDTCNSSYDKRITNDMICIGKYDTGGADACGGDSGGPATVQVSSSLNNS
jgi:trypsin